MLNRIAYAWFKNKTGISFSLLKDRLNENEKIYRISPVHLPAHAYMKKEFSVSLCISTYNWPEALELCLLSVLMQTRLPEEIIIGDDGSTEQTTHLIDKMRTKFSMPVVHIRHPDDGFRLAHIRNKSFAKASGEYIIQVDGDVIMHPFFIADHVRFAQPNSFVAGTRSLLTEMSSKQLLHHKNLEELLNLELEKKYNARRNKIAAHIIYHLQRGMSQTKYVLGANMAFWRKDLLAVNGYNENYRGWGKEDNDLSARLCNAGVALHFLRFAAVICHLHHKEAKRDTLANNERLLSEAMLTKQTYATDGMDKYL